MNEPERSDVLAQLRLRILREHGGLGDGWRDHWNLTPGDSLMHREAVDIHHCADVFATFRPDLHARLLDFKRRLKAQEPKDDFPEDYEVN